MRKRYKWSRRSFVATGAVAAASLLAACVPAKDPGKPAATTGNEPGPVGDPKSMLDPKRIPKFASPLLVPGAMPKKGVVKRPDGVEADYYEVSMRQFKQQVLPAGMPKTTVWGYGPAGSDAQHSAPSLTIEATQGRPTRVKWVNELVDADGKFLPHLLPVDQTLHWANPVGGDKGRDSVGTEQKPYTGPVPIVTHVHGAHTYDDSDGFTSAWYLPDAKDIPSTYAKTGSWYDTFANAAKKRFGADWGPGYSVFEYPNDQRAGTLWYHDHALGMTRLNVYAGPAGFYLLRGGADDLVDDSTSSKTPGSGTAVLPGGKGDDVKYELPLAIQDRSFRGDGSLFYPDNRAFFEGLKPEQLQIPFAPQRACTGPSDIPSIWNPEFFGTTIIVNGQTWPFHKVEPRQYRLRLLNGCQSRALKVSYDGDVAFTLIGTEGGFLPQPVKLKELLLGPAERADVIVSFAGLSEGTKLRLVNKAPDEPYNGGEQDPADPDTTGQIMEFRVVKSTGADPTTPADRLVLPKRAAMPAVTNVQQVSVNELDSATVKVLRETDGTLKLACTSKDAEVFGPSAGILGVLKSGKGDPRNWDDTVTENPKPGAVEEWEIHNFTVDAHPIHIHQVMFEVLGRGPRKLAPGEEGALGKPKRGPEAWEHGLKDTVLCYPGEITRVRMHFKLSGVFVWHCHIIEHEDNEMMRPLVVGPVPAKLSSAKM